ncbi:O-antigen ligase family protein [Robbsia sp. KACC 23696]|uniref:O-antigen ligase family protein n=1 Tax=Robbsia sp. KACC 23696 TaxID=3149231 RepID=UPI00325AFBC4
MIRKTTSPSTSTDTAEAPATPPYSLPVPPTGALSAHDTTYVADARRGGDTGRAAHEPGIASPTGTMRRRLSIGLVVLACAYPVASLNVQGVANGMLFLFALIGLFSLPTLTGRGMPPQVRGSLVGIAILGWLPFVAALANEVARVHWVPRNLDLPLRFALLGPCIACACRIGVQRGRHLQWGLIGASMFCGAREIYVNFGVARVSEVGLINTIPYSDVTLTFGFLTLMTLGWTLAGPQRPRLAAIETLLKVLAFVVALGGSVASGSRGGWLAIPVLGALSWYALALRATPGNGAACSDTPIVAHSRRALPVLIVLGAALGLWHAWPRLTEAFSNIAVFLQGGHFNTPIGIRFEVWRASVMMLAQHPLVGVGYDQFMPTLAALIGEGKIPAVLLGLPHSHNDMLFALATTGSLGGIALLSLYLVPFGKCLRWTLEARTREARCLAAMGTALPLSYLVYGLTETMFIISMDTALFVFMSALLLALARAATLVSVASDTLPDIDARQRDSRVRAAADRRTGG